MRIRLCALLFLVTTLGFSQGEATNWYFGRNAGLDFNSGDPVPLLNGELSAIEGCGTISDPDGSLLFYSDGVTIWNRNHQVMPNGEELKGSTSSSQSVLIVPNPGNSALFYTFTTDDALLFQTGKANGFNYSVVDMSQDNGRGDVVEKNINLLPIGSEKVTGVYNFTNNFYWVITHFQNAFYAYRVDENGVDPNPVISTVGPNENNFANGRGTLKISPNAAKIAMSYLIVSPRYDTSLYVFDFDVATGQVTNPIAAVDHTRAYYGLEFSSNSKKLYASGVNFDTDNTLGLIDILQFDLEKPDFFSNETTLLRFSSNGTTFVSGGLQIGVDKKIYHTLFNKKLSVIERPNQDGPLAGAKKFSIDLGGRQSLFGLPNFVQSFFETIVRIENFCFGEAMTFTPDDATNILDISWNFGDPASENNNTLNAITGVHVFSAPGSYTVTANVTYSNATQRRFVEQVEVFDIPSLPPELTLVQCDVDGVDDGYTTFNLNESFSFFNVENETTTVWFFLSELDAIENRNRVNDAARFQNTSFNQHVYARVFKNEECFTIVEVNLTVAPLTYLENYDTLFICDVMSNNQSVLVDMGKVYDHLYKEFAGYEEVTVFLDKQSALLEMDVLKQREYPFALQDSYAVYFRVEEDNACAFIGKLNLNISLAPEYEETVQVYLCNGEIRLETLKGYENYLWSDGSSQTSLRVAQTGTIDVVFGNGPCLYAQTFEVLPELEIGVEEVLVSDFRRNNSLEVVLDPRVNADEFIFSIDGGRTFGTSNTFTNLLPGIYEVMAMDNCSVFEKEVIVGGMPSFFTPNNDGANDRFQLNNPEFFPAYQMSVFNRYGKLLSSFTAQDNGWDGTYGSMEMPPDDYWYVLELEGGRTIKGYFTLKR
ncbi:MAG: T9SS type B sorting domain-containing protein [Bacteroidota bacterium]